MKMPDCFDAYRILALLAAGLLVAGCDSGVSTGSGGSDGCTSGLTKPSNFEEQFNDFTIGENLSENPVGADLEKTLFRQFFKATEPVQGKSPQADKLYAFMGDETDTVADFNDPDSLPDYTSVRNGFDLFEAMATSNQFESLKLARQAMASCARDAQQALKDGKDPVAGNIGISTITVTEKPDDEVLETWSFSVDYFHNPEPFIGTTPFDSNITRVLITRPDLQFIFSSYDFEQFIGDGAASGFKQPTKLVAGFNATLEQTLDSNAPEEDGGNDQTDGTANGASIVFESYPFKNTQDDRENERGETDRWEWSFSEGTDQFMVENDETGEDVPASCVRVTKDYSSDSSENQVTVELSAETCPRFNEASAEFQRDGGFSYTPKSPDVSQTR